MFILSVLCIFCLLADHLHATFVVLMWICFCLFLTVKRFCSWLKQTILLICLTFWSEKSTILLPYVGFNDSKMHAFYVLLSVQLSLPSSMRIMRGFDHVYVAAQLHFHWGTTEVPGSEHTIDNVHFPAEVSSDKGNMPFNGLYKTITAFTHAAFSGKLQMTFIVSRSYCEM